MGAAATRISIARRDPATDKAALTLATQAWPDAERSAYQQTVDSLINRGRADQLVLLAARDGDCLIVAQLAQLLPGRAAAVWPPQFAAEHQAQCDSVSASLFSQLARELTALGPHLAQALLSTRDEIAAKLFSRGGFSHVADLLYLAGNLNEIGNAQGALPYELDPFQPGDEPRLAALIDRTYVGTLDCPQLDGLRHTGDVITGYQAVGAFHPELWLIARDRAQDIGCLLMNWHPDVRHAEIVYVALVPEVRGRGWGLELIKKAVELARRVLAERIVLAVDAANQPAIRVYQALGFFEFDRRAVWVRSLTEISK